MIFRFNTPFQVLFFRLKTRGKNSNLYWPRQKNLNIDRYEYENRFLEFLDSHDCAAWIKRKGLLIELTESF